MNIDQFIPILKVSSNTFMDHNIRYTNSLGGAISLAIVNTTNALHGVVIDNRAIDSHLLKLYLDRVIEECTTSNIVRESFLSKYKIYETIMRLSQEIARSTRRGVGNVCFISSQLFGHLLTELSLVPHNVVVNDGVFMLFNIKIVRVDTLRDMFIVAYINLVDSRDNGYKLAIDKKVDDTRFFLTKKIMVSATITCDKDSSKYYQVVKLV